MPFARPWITVIPDAATLARAVADPREVGSTGAFELRLDLWERPPALGDLSGIPVPIVVTWKRGGSREAERIRFLKDLLTGRAGDLWLDLDVEDPAVLRGLPVASPRPEGVRVLMSRHLHRPMTDAALRGAARNLLRPGVDAGKLVLAAGDFDATAQALRLADELRSEACPVTVFAAGIDGTFSRFAAVARGDRWGYGAVGGGAPVVAGQPIVSTIATRYGGGFPTKGAGNAVPPFVCVIGADVSRSISPGFHNRVLTAAGSDERWFDLSVEDPAPLLGTDGLFPWPPRAFAVTAPHKGWARGCGRAGAPGEEMHVAWNTLARRDDAWVGWNTDVPALLECLDQAGASTEAPVLLLGAGGTAQPIARELSRRGTPVWVLERRPGPLPEALAEACVSKVGPEAIADAGVLVNTTGARGPLPWPVESFRGTIAVEYTYRNSPTDFLERACAHGARSIEGVALFAEQARLQSKVLHGIDVPSEEALRIAREALREVEESSPEVEE